MGFMSSSEKGLELSEGIGRILDGAEYTKPPSSYWRARQWKLRGTPFSGRGLGSDQRLMIHLLTRILRHFHHQGWRMVASADVSAKYHKDSDNDEEYPLDTHSWFFLHDPDTTSEQEAGRGELCLDLEAVEE